MAEFLEVAHFAYPVSLLLIFVVLFAAQGILPFRANTNLETGFRKYIDRGAEKEGYPNTLLAAIEANNTRVIDIELGSLVATGASDFQLRTLG